MSANKDAWQEACFAEMSRQMDSGDLDQTEVHRRALLVALEAIIPGPLESAGGWFTSATKELGLLSDLEWQELLRRAEDDGFVTGQPMQYGGPPLRKLRITAAGRAHVRRDFGISASAESTSLTVEGHGNIVAVGDGAIAATALVVQFAEPAHRDAAIAAAALRLADLVESSDVSALDLVAELRRVAPDLESPEPTMRERAREKMGEIVTGALASVIAAPGGAALLEALQALI